MKGPSIRRSQMIREVCTHLKEVQSLSIENREKLIKLLQAILVAEAKVDRHGKWHLRLGKIVLNALGIGNWFYRTLGSWNLHICHAEKFGLTPVEFRKQMRKDASGLPYVIHFILRYIGIEKNIVQILGEYHIGFHAIPIATLQHSLNKHLDEKLTEDGILGEKTSKVIEQLSLPLPCKTDVNAIWKLIQKLEQDSLWIIPLWKKKRKHPLRNHINTSLYLKSGIEAFLALSENHRESLKSFPAIFSNWDACRVKSTQ